MKISYYLPEKIITNSDLEKEFPEWSADKIEKKVGINSRHVSNTNETALDLAEQACTKLFSEHPNIRTSIDYLIFCTQNPDFIFPGNASILQDRLGLSTKIGAFDYNLGCSGYVYGLSIAKGLLSAGIANNILLITAECYTKRINKKDKGNRSIFGDAASATFLTKEDIHHIGKFVLGTDGLGVKNLIIRNGGMRYPMHSRKEKQYGSGNRYTDNDIFMDGPEIFNFTIGAVPPLIKETLEINELKKEEIKFFVYHQANMYILNFLRKLSKIPEEKFYMDMYETGNTVSNTIPIALSKLCTTKKICQGDKVLLAGFGVGYSYGATVITI